MQKTFASILQEVRIAHQRNRLLYSWREGWQYSTEQALQRSGVGKADECVVLSAALSQCCGGPKHFLRGKPTGRAIARCASILHRYQFGAFLKCLNEALRLYRVENFTEKSRLRSEAGQITGPHGGKKVRELPVPPPTPKPVATPTPQSEPTIESWLFEGMGENYKHPD